ncbi:enolase, partial [Candidatus Pacearchaeota archaeon]|nr:enolase [Candidatus Pacearchaeota archaeon]
MIIKKVIAISILDSRKKPTIHVSVITDKGRFFTSAPSGKSTGEHEVPTYA